MILLRGHRLQPESNKAKRMAKRNFVIHSQFHVHSNIHSILVITQSNSNDNRIPTSPPQVMLANCTVSQSNADNSSTS